MKDTKDKEEKREFKPGETLRVTSFTWPKLSSKKKKEAEDEEVRKEDPDKVPG